jgi:hypothetical protein
LAHDPYFTAKKKNMRRVRSTDHSKSEFNP